MNDDQARHEVVVDPQMRIVIDQVGDPYVWLRVVLPEGTALSADQLEQLALKLLGAAAASRTRAQMVRKQLFAGIPPQEAVRFVGEMLDE